MAFALDQRDILGLDLVEHDKPGGGLYTKHDKCLWEASIT